jgi:hypothetical protein
MILIAIEHPERQQPSTLRLQQTTASLIRTPSIPGCNKAAKHECHFNYAERNFIIGDNNVKVAGSSLHFSLKDYNFATQLF